MNEYTTTGEDCTSATSRRASATADPAYEFASDTRRAANASAAATTNASAAATNRARAGADFSAQAIREHDTLELGGCQRHARVYRR